jgi:hypothetical protein
LHGQMTLATTTPWQLLRRLTRPFRKQGDCLFRLYGALRKTEDLTEEVKEILRGHESQISELEQINIEADRLEWVDYWDIHMQNASTTILIKSFPNFLAFSTTSSFRRLSPSAALSNCPAILVNCNLYAQADSQEHVLPCPDTPQYS